MLVPDCVSKMFLSYRVINGVPEKIDWPAKHEDRLLREFETVDGVVLTPLDLRNLEEAGLALNEEGLYRIFSTDGGTSYQFIKFDQNVFRLAEAISNCLIHGTADKVPEWSGASFLNLTKTVKFRNIEVTCGTAARLFSYLAFRGGFSGRVVSLENTSARIGTSHIMAEIWIKHLEKRVLFDVDIGCFFKNHGEFLNFQDLRSIRKNGGDFELEFIGGKSHRMRSFICDYIYSSRIWVKEFMEEIVDCEKITVSEWVNDNGRDYLVETAVFEKGHGS